MRPNIVTTQLRGLTDLTVLAPIKEGFVEGTADNNTYLKRLEAVLRTLNAARLASSESALHPSPFPDSVGRFRIIHFFRFAIVKPDAGGDPTRPGRHKLLLNVTFDGGWEPYIRVIWRDLGSLLDLLYCNCEGYPPAHLTSFDTYAKWVRANEVQTSFFYADSILSSSDQRYLATAEAIQRKGGNAADIDAELAKLTLASSASQARSMLAAAEANATTREAAAEAGLRALKVFLGLALFFPGTQNGDNGYLLRFTQDVLKEFHELARKADFFTHSDKLRALKGQFKGELDWFVQDRGAAEAPAERLKFVPTAVQGGILSSYDGVTHGCMALVCIDDPAAAIEFLKTYKVSAEQAKAEQAKEAEQGIFRNIAFTFRGLGRLGVKEAQLEKFPQEFFEGMETRAGLLGDIRTNHPAQWRRPQRNWKKGEGRTKGIGRIELSTVHIVAQFRVAPGTNGDPVTRLQDQVKQLELNSGLQVLSIQHMRSYVDSKAGMPREQFGFLDGFSQPVAMDSLNPKEKDAVKRGEILLGYGNDRGDRPTAEQDTLMDNGTFLVVRKLRQYVDRLNEVLKAQAEELNRGDVSNVDVPFLKARMMGRTVEGDPLAASGTKDNQFDYGKDADGSLCPFQSHARRANPREPGMPRILRRGMSFDSRDFEEEEEERGVVFMAYNASIAEQFEVIQRWISGGNSSGVLSTHSDPFLGVPDNDGDRILRFVNGQKVLRVNLGKEPFVELDWGLYLFVPSIDALKDLAAIVNNNKASTPAPTPSPAVKPSEDFLRWQRLLEDKDCAEAGWAQVRAAPQGVLQTDYGLLVGSKDGVLKVFQDDGSRYSVCGYGERMNDSIGLGYLGMDPSTGHKEQSPGVNAVIAGVSEKAAFDLARGVAETYLKALKVDAESRKLPEVPITTSALSDHVMAALCTEWFGLPDADGTHMKAGGRGADPDKRPATCPAHFYSAARLIFSPRPTDKVAQNGKVHGAHLREATKNALAKGGPGGTLAPAIKAALEKSLGSRWNDDDLFARTLVGIMQGFPPTVDGNLRTVLGMWLTDRRLWDFQVALLASADPTGHATAERILRGPLLATMRLRPVPDMLWRTAKGEALSGEVRADNRVVVGIVSALRDGADDALMFGGQFGETTHACPGRKMAIGVMLGTISALMAAGTIRPTGLPLAFTLVV